MLKRLAALTVLAVGSVSVANAASISGFFSGGSGISSDQFTSSTVTFNGGIVSPAIGGDFFNYLAPGAAINFLSGALPYTTGVNITPPPAQFPSGFVPLFTINGSQGEVFTFDMTSYTGAFTTGAGCTNGSACLAVTAVGTIVGTGPLTGQSGVGTVTFTSQYTSGAPIGGPTAFSATASFPAATPEPASLALVGSGLLAIGAIARRRFAIN